MVVKVLYFFLIFSELDVAVSDPGKFYTQSKILSQSVRKHTERETVFPIEEKL